MSDTSKLKKLLKTTRDPREIQDWLFSLTPVGVAFVFYIFFIISTDIEPKGEFIAYGAAAAFIGLETYWIIRGWQRNHAITIVMGLVGICIALGALVLYVNVT
jgi:hypothetical protein